jgi:hypothetical protein
LKYRVGAWRRLAVVAARLKRDDERTAAGAVAGSREGIDLGMRPAELLVPALAGKLPGGIEHDRTDERVRLDPAAAAFRQRKGVPHPAFDFQAGGGHRRFPEKNGIRRELSRPLCIYLMYDASGTKRNRFAMRTIQERTTPSFGTIMTRWYPSFDLRLPVLGRLAVEPAAKTLRGESDTG